MQRSSGLNPISAKRRAKLAAAGVAHPSSTFAAAAKAARKKPAKRPTVTGPDRSTVEAVLERDHHSCVACGRGVHGQRGVDWSVGHRRPRRMGGDPRPDTNLPSNLVILHGSGTTLCHGELESRRGESLAKGLLLHDRDVPSQRPIEHAIHGWCYLTDTGEISYAPPPINDNGEES